MPKLISTMNDTKWRRLIDAIALLCLPVSYWRFLHDDSEYMRTTPQPDEIRNGVSVGDTSVIGPFYFRDVQTVRWPERYETLFGPQEPTRISQQPLADLASAIERAGQFDFSTIHGSLILYAYRDIR